MNENVLYIFRKSLIRRLNSNVKWMHASVLSQYIRVPSVLGTTLGTKDRYLSVKANVLWSGMMVKYLTTHHSPMQAEAKPAVNRFSWTSASQLRIRKTWLFLVSSLVASEILTGEFHLSLSWDQDSWVSLPYLCVLCSCTSGVVQGLWPPTAPSSSLVPGADLNFESSTSSASSDPLHFYFLFVTYLFWGSQSYCNILFHQSSGPSPSSDHPIASAHLYFSSGIYFSWLFK